MSLGSSFSSLGKLFHTRDKSVERKKSKDKGSGGQASDASSATKPSTRTSTTSIDVSHPRSKSAATESRSGEHGTVSIAQLASSLQQEPTASTSTILPAAPTATSTKTAISTETASAAVSLPQRLWDRAYDELKAEESTLLMGYEKILSRTLNENGPSCGESRESTIEQKDLDTRQRQMKQLVDAGLRKTEREANVKHGIGEAVQVVLSAKDMISSAIQAVPQAALAWTGVCFALQVSYCQNRHGTY